MLSTSASYSSHFVSIVYNGHAGLGANLVDDAVDARHLDSSKNEVSIESLAARQGPRLGNGIVSDNKDPDVAARADKAVSLFLPEVDDEVLVAFEHGEPRRPCLIAPLWNSGDMPAEMSR
jgi:Type VI secretion system/phage-baseplate injector OB domain